jgi:hypothetical protein
MAYVVFEDREEPHAFVETLAKAFNAVLRNCRYQPFWWKSSDGSLILQMRYADGLFAGKIVGVQFGEKEPLTFAAPIGGGEEFARRLIMSKVIGMGLRGRYAMREGEFWHGNMGSNAHEIMAKMRELKALH